MRILLYYVLSDPIVLLLKNTGLLRVLCFCLKAYKRRAHRSKIPFYTTTTQRQQDSLSPLSTTTLESPPSFSSVSSRIPLSPQFYLGVESKGGESLMPVSHYRESPEDPLRIPLVYALTPGGSPGDSQGIFSSVTPALHGGQLLLHSPAPSKHLGGKEW